MSASIEWKVTGQRELVEYLRTLPSYVQREILEPTVVSGALILVNAVKSIALDKHILETGTLIRSYHIGAHAQLTPDFAGGMGYSDIEGVQKTPQSYGVAIGTNLPYARRQEFGFMGQDSLGRQYHQAPRPHLREAFDTKQDAVRDEMVDTFRTLLLARKAA